MRLLYQPVPVRGDDATFAEALCATRRGSGLLRVASPYLGVEVFRGLVGAVPYRLLTDIDESSEAVRELGFGADRVRHVPGLHAKVLIGDEAAVFGSLNFTKEALTRRFELGCVVTDSGVLEELRRWFDALWDQVAEEIDEERLAKGIRRSALRRTARSEGGRQRRHATGSMGPLLEGDDAPSGEWTSDLDATAPPARREVARSDLPAELETAAQNLRRLATGRSEARLALGWLSEALQVSGLREGDERLYLGDKRGRLTVCVGERNVAWMKRVGETAVLALALSDEPTAARALEKIPGAALDRFTNGSPIVHIPFGELGKRGTIWGSIRASWRRAIAVEVAWDHASPYRQKHHQPALYEELLDGGRGILRAAFPGAWWFGVNNGVGGHVQLDAIAALLDGGVFRWPRGSSKVRPATAYDDMCVGDPVLLWTGHGRNREWGVIGTARVETVRDEEVVLGGGSRLGPLTPYPKGHPTRTAVLEGLFSALGADFLPLADVRRAVEPGLARPTPVTVHGVSIGSFERVTALARSLGDGAARIRIG